jgi:hypothetical protein
MQRSIELSDAQLHELERLASQEDRSVDELVQLAVGDYLARHQTRSEWSARLSSAVAAIRASVPPDVTPDGIEADVTTALQEHRAHRAAQRKSVHGLGAGSH